MKKLQHCSGLLGEIGNVDVTNYSSYFNLGVWLMFDLAHFVGENRWLFEGVECSLLDLKASFLSTLNAL
jgi:hypothetical protein